MIVLDTNVVSEALRLDPSPQVLTWMRQRRLETLYIAAPGLAELSAGIEVLPAGHRKSTLGSGLNQFIEQRVRNRVLAFDQQAAEAYAIIIATARRKGIKVSAVDGQIAAIATVHGYSVATRDVRPFVAGNVPVINPWEPSASTP